MRQIAVGLNICWKRPTEDAHAFLLAPPDQMKIELGQLRRQAKCHLGAFAGIEIANVTNLKNGSPVFQGRRSPPVR